MTSTSQTRILLLASAGATLTLLFILVAATSSPPSASSPPPPPPPPATLVAAAETCVPEGGACQAGTKCCDCTGWGQNCCIPPGNGNGDGGCAGPGPAPAPGPAPGPGPGPGPSQCLSTPPLANHTIRSIPASIIGYYWWNWEGKNVPRVQGPPESNFGITFAGARASGTNGAWVNKSKKCGPQTSPHNNITGVNFLSVGGGLGKGPPAGPQSFDSKDVTAYLNFLPNITGLGYDGVCFDIESGNASIEEFKHMLNATKQAGLQVMVTISYFATKNYPPFGGKAGIINELVTTVFTNSTYVDILSPQLYSGNCNDPVWTGTAGGGDWNGIITNASKEAYRNCPFLAPTINSDSWHEIQTAWSGCGLPHPKGYFMYCNTTTNGTFEY